MSTPEERSRCGRKVRATVGKDGGCLCVAGAILEIPAGAIETETEVTLEAIDFARSDFPASKFPDERPMSKVFVARFSEPQLSQFIIWLWVDLPRTPPSRFWGRSHARGPPPLTGDLLDYWVEDFGVHDEPSNMVGLGALMVTEQMSFVVMTER